MEINKKIDNRHILIIFPCLRKMIVIIIKNKRKADAPCVLKIKIYYSILPDKIVDEIKART